MRRTLPILFVMMLPAALFFSAFFLLPMVQLAIVGASGKDGIAAYTSIVSNPNHLRALLATLAISTATTVLTLTISAIAGVFLQRNAFPGRAALVAMLTLPLAFPGVVVGFMVIILAGRQGLIGTITQALTGEKVIFAYSMTGLLMGYVYFSIPRTILTVMATAEKLDPRLEEAARSLGASSWQVVRDVILPGLKPAFISAGAICFATAMGAFGTAFTLATRIDVLPMVIYTEFTLQASIAVAAALSLVLGLVSWLALTIARTAAGATVAAAG